MTNQEIAKRLVELVGGKENIKSATNCMTRCRLELNDYSKADIVAIKKSEGALGVVENKGQLQVIYGPGKVNKVTEELKKLIGKNVLLGEEAVRETKAKLKEKNDTKFKNALKKIGNIFIPLIPLFVASGLVLAVNNIAGVYFGDVYKSTTSALIIGLIGNGVFSILSILVGVNAAKEFGSQMPMMGGVLGGILSSASLAKITLFGVALTPGRGGIISVILVVLLACYVEKICRSFVPDVLDLFVTPLVTLTVSVLAALFILQPAGGFISDSIGLLVAQTIASDNMIVSVISGTISGALFLPLVMTGMHQALTPIHADLIANVGFTVLLPILATAGMAQVGATIAVLRTTKNERLKKMAKNGLIPGFLGIGEPLIYGVTLPLGRPFLGACLGAGVGGAVMAFFKVGAVALGVSGLPLALLIADGKMLVFLVGVLTSYIAGYFFTKMLGFEDPVE
ncbi:PTS transporter subunit EIIC [Clostridium gasigenes]|uniref:PTS system IIB component, Glc family /PTS system IIC component, Glc family n=1 Tax=Clostridium gasigenes TaxID=94869 RepID=A0A1H0PXQ3_9CLOT|nr:PTS transporter subunit EIIC [Clostridium gasigenes]MBB6624213.1 PTS transporter subunit EIIC [Clostridium gasigenes]MBU3088170.1 PTS transporter subunit EIIC [Clostridium gasigenes]NKF08710.1 PTS transporter subunit EIIC [Clostridium gasigenes]QSW21192.1 PTS transporter subunit EIIC [Clostridium gasigenes]SDP09961.1 PTS system IIB component, Glc family /PTS system IIC component, Glc family [Clostridium gasigenes]